MLAEVELHLAHIQTYSSRIHVDCGFFALERPSPFMQLSLARFGVEYRGDVNYEDASSRYSAGGGIYELGGMLCR